MTLTPGLVAGIWCCHRRDAASVSAWEPKPRLKLLQAEASGGQNEEAGPSPWLHSLEQESSQEPVCAGWLSGRFPPGLFPRPPCLGLKPHLEMLSVSPWGSSQGDPESAPGTWRRHRSAGGVEGEPPSSSTRGQRSKRGGPEDRPAVSLPETQSLWEPSGPSGPPTPQTSKRTVVIRMQRRAAAGVPSQPGPGGLPLGPRLHQARGRRAPLGLRQPHVSDTNEGPLVVPLLLPDRISCFIVSCLPAL